MKRQLPGRVAPVAGPVSDEARRDAVVSAAVAYVAALRDWEAGAYSANRRKAMHRCQRELIAAVALVAACQGKGA
jgi:hypothetical protein